MFLKTSHNYEHMENLLSVNNIEVCFSLDGKIQKAVESIEFGIKSAETLAIVGESGSGKSVTALSIMGLIQKTGGKITKGSVLFERESGESIDLVRASDEQMRMIRGNEIAMVFQEPMTSLNPVFTVGDQIKEALMIHQNMTNKDADSYVLDVLDQVKISEPKRRFQQYPHELSGGMRQRVMIAMALVCRPKLLIADEPSTALDVTIQAQILWLLSKLKEETGTSLLFITHDLGIVAQIAERVVVMSEGKVVESGTVHQIFRSPSQTYTQNLLNSVPILGTFQSEIDTERPTTETTIKIEHATIRFPLKSRLFSKYRKEVLAVDDVSFEVRKGKTLGLVGESGCGKSTICRAIVGLANLTAGLILVGKTKIVPKTRNLPLEARRSTQIIFQDPLASLSPRRTAFNQIAEPLKIHNYGSKLQIQERVEWLVEKVGLTKKQLERYPHEFSGGQRQRLCIARAIALNPQVLIADEPVSALDVSIQAKVLDLLTSLQEEFSITFLFVSHDMAVVEKMSDDIAVMYMGRIVEYGDRNSILSNPVHPYTQNLLTSVPIPNPEIKMNEPKFYEKGRISPIISADQKVSKEIEYKSISPTHRVIVS